MGKLIIEEWISLNGCASGKGGSLDFFAPHVRGSYVHRAAMLDNIGTILLGRKTYEQFALLWPGRPADNDPLAMLINTTEKIVFSRSLSKVPWGDWDNAIVEQGDPLEKIAMLKTTGTKDMIVWGSISIAQLLMRHDLIDEYHLHLCPEVVDGEKRFFPGNALPATFSLTGTNCYANGILHLQYKKNNSI